MKILISLFVLISMHANAEEFLGKKDKKSVMSMLYQACENAWCENDFYYTFTAIECDDVTSTCTIQLSMSPQGDMEEESMPSVDGVCKLTNMKTLEDLLDFNDYGPSEKVYYQMHDCFGDLEENYYGAPENP